MKNEILELADSSKGVQKKLKKYIFNEADRIIINIKPAFLPLFFQQNELKKSIDVQKEGNHKYIYAEDEEPEYTSYISIEDKEKQKWHDIKFIMNNIEIKDVGKGDTFLQDTLTGKWTEIDKRKSYTQNIIDFSEQLYSDYFNEDFSHISSVGEIIIEGRIDKLHLYEQFRNKKPNSYFWVYNQFKNKPVEAAHFMTQRYIETGGGAQKCICTDVMTINIKRKKVSVDFIFEDWQQGIGIDEMRRMDLNFFRIYKKFGKEKLPNLTKFSQVGELGNVKIDFYYVMNILKKNCVKENYDDVDDIFIDEQTGWICAFAKRYSSTRMFASSAEKNTGTVPHLELLIFNNRMIERNISLIRDDTREDDTKDDALFVRHIK